MARTAVQQLALHIADEGGHLGFHDERWYSDDQRRAFEDKARNVIQLLSNDGYTILPKSALDWLFGEAGEFTPPENAKGRFWWRSEFRRRAGISHNGG
jgi:hypothetical protein